jgi:hypothetical protein
MRTLVTEKREDWPTVTEPKREKLSIDQEMLAILMWDYFGGRIPRGLSSIRRGVPKATEEQRDQYRRCAAKIAQALEAEFKWQASWRDDA